MSKCDSLKIGVELIVKNQGRKYLRTHGLQDKISLQPKNLKKNYHSQIPLCNLSYCSILQWNLSKADTIGTMKWSPLYVSVRFIEITFNRV